MLITSFNEWLITRGKRIAEISHDLASELEDWHNDNQQLPFDNLFPNGGLREVIPFSSDPIPLKIIDKLDDNGFTIDFSNGTVVKEKRATRLGKLMLQKPSQYRASLFSPEEQNWWSSQGHPMEALQYAFKHKDYVIVVSRSPYDIVRMSDHGEWTSCHDQGREYFQCAVAEAKGGGPIAYVINRHDLEHIPNLQSPEIFRDSDRRVSGIKPLSRIRLRMFKNTKDDYNLAVPEVTSYGKSVPGFKDTLRQWAMQNQQDVLHGERPRMKDFVRMGGSYTDNAASTLFNSFFGDKEDKGDADYEGEEGQNLLDQYEEEVRAIDDEFQKLFHFAHANAQVEDDRGDGVPYVYMTGGIYVDIPIEAYNLPNWNENQKRRELKDHIEKLCSGLHIYGVQDVEVQDGHNGGVNVRVDLQYENGGYGRDDHPDSYREFCQELLRDVEPKRDEFISGVVSILIDLNYIDPHYISKFMGHSDVDEDWAQPQFAHFAWEEDEDMGGHAILVSPKEKIPVGNMHGLDAEFLQGWRTGIPEDAPGMAEFKSQFLGHINQMADAYIQYLSHSKQQKLLWGQPDPKQKPFSGSFKIQPRLILSFDTNHMVQMSMEFNLNVGQPEEDVKDAMGFIKYMDQNYDRFVRDSQALFSRVVTPKYNRVQAQPEPVPQQPQPVQIPVPQQPVQEPAPQNQPPKAESVTDFLTWLSIKNRFQQRHSHV